MNDMKKIYALFALPALMLTACSDDINPDVPETVPGEDIVFKASLPQGTRTVYGDFNADGTARKVMWVNGDKVNVFSPQCEANFRQAEYEVKVANNQSYADELVKTGTTGLRWGTASATETKFYAAYPENATLAQESDGTVTASFHIDDVQTTLMQSATTNGKTVWSPSATAPTPNNIMFAQPLANGQSQVTTVDGKTVANLQFTPYSTVLHMTFAGWALTDPDLQGADDMTVYSVRLNSTGTSDIAGNFPLTLKADGTAPTVGNNVTLGNKSITVNVDAGAEINGISLKPGDSFECDLFMIPTGATISDQWSVDLITSAGTFSRKLKPAADANSTLKPGQIHKMNFPAINLNNGWEYHPDSWLADIPDNVYFTEVSLPGAWYAYDGMNTNRGVGLITYGGNEGYQKEGATVSDLFNAGIRAFQIESRMGYESPIPGGVTYSYPVISGTGRNQSGSYVSAIRVSTFVDALVSALPATSKEFAVLAINYTDGQTDGTSDEYKQRWLNGLNSMLSGYGTRIYNETITPETPVSKLRGKIVVLINVDAEVENNVTTWPDALLAYTNQSWSASTMTTSMISPMTWKSWPGISGVDISAVGQNPDNLYLNYTLANRTWDGTGTQPSGMPSLDNRLRSIESLIGNSDHVYASKTHNCWYYIGAGGTYAPNLSEDSDKEGPQNIAKAINPELIKMINAKVDEGKASPMGLVFINQCTGEGFSGNEIVEAIIRMNRRFKLLGIGGTQGGGTGTQTNIKSVIPTHSSGYNKAAGNGWNAF